MYEIKRVEVDPFDIMCGDCPEHEIEWWEEAALEDLHTAHAEELEMDANMPDWMIKEMRDEGEWHPASPDFDEWLKGQIEKGHVRLAA